MHHLCLLQHITVLIPTFGNWYLNIGLIWVGLVPPENWAGKTLWSHIESLPHLRTCWLGQRYHNLRVWLFKGCRRPNTCKYCTRISQSGKITNLNNNTTYNTVTKGTCQSNNLIYCLECKWCHIKYVGQTKNRIIDRFQGHIFDIKHITKPLWLDIFIATMIIPIPVWLYIYLST